MREDRNEVRLATVGALVRLHISGLVGVEHDTADQYRAYVRDYVDPFHAGAAVAFGLMGMAEAIHRNERRKQAAQDYEDRKLEADMG